VHAERIGRRREGRHGRVGPRGAVQAGGCRGGDDIWVEFRRLRAAGTRRAFQEPATVAMTLPPQEAQPQRPRMAPGSPPARTSRGSGRASAVSPSGLPLVSPPARPPLAGTLPVPPPATELRPPPAATRRPDLPVPRLRRRRDPRSRRLNSACCAPPRPTARTRRPPRARRLPRATCSPPPCCPSPGAPFAPTRCGPLPQPRPPSRSGSAAAKCCGPRCIVALPDG